jgi:hypothetical protein
MELLGLINALIAIFNFFAFSSLKDYLLSQTKKKNLVEITLKEYFDCIYKDKPELIFIDRKVSKIVATLRITFFVQIILTVYLLFIL